VKIGDKVLVKKAMDFYYENDRRVIREKFWFKPTEMLIIGICTKYEGKSDWVNEEVGNIFTKSKGHRLYECRKNLKDRDIFLAREEDLELKEES